MERTVTLGIGGKEMLSPNNKKKVQKLLFCVLCWPFSDIVCVTCKCMCMCICASMCVYVHTCVQACGGQKAVLGATECQALSSLFLEAS